MMILKVIEKIKNGADPESAINAALAENQKEIARTVLKYNKIIGAKNDTARI